MSCICCVLRVICCVLFVVCYLLFGVGHFMFVVWCVLVAIRCFRSLIVACSLSVLGVRCLMCGVVPWS